MSVAHRAPIMPAPGIMSAGGRLHLFIAHPAPAAQMEHLTSKDGLFFRRELPVLRASDGEQWEAGGFGGIQVAAGKGYRMLYTGFGRYDGARSSAIGCAESPDLCGWRRSSAGPVLKPSERWYESSVGADAGLCPAWGDPFVLFDRHKHVYRAYVSARRSRRIRAEARACVASATSPDMISWKVGPPVFAPGRFDIIGAPLVVVAGGRYHLLYHVLDPDGGVRVCRAASDSPTGPFESPKDDTFFCGGAVCVRPAVFGDDDMLLFVHAVRDEDSGSEEIRVWPSLLRFDEQGVPRAMLHEAVTRRQGEPLIQADAELESSETVVRLLPRRAEDMILSARLRVEDARRVGILFRTNLTGRDNNTLWLDVPNERISLHRGVRGMPLVSAPCNCAPALREGRGELRLTIAASGRLVVVYVNDVLVMSGAVANRRAGGIGVAVDGGKASFSEVTLRPLQLHEE